jgi:hypothetical protein
LVNQEVNAHKFGLMKQVAHYLRTRVNTLTDLCASFVSNYHTTRPAKVICDFQQVSETTLGNVFSFRTPDDAPVIAREPNWISKIASVVEALVPTTTFEEDMEVEDLITLFSRSKSTLLNARTLLHSLLSKFIENDRSNLLISHLFTKLNSSSLHWVCLLLGFDSTVMGDRLSLIPVDVLKKEDFAANKHLLVVSGDQGICGYMIVIKKKPPTQNDLYHCLRIILQAKYPSVATRFKEMIEAGSLLDNDKKKKKNDVQNIVSQAKSIIEVCLTSI